jgi:hypothetical protein
MKNEVVRSVAAHLLACLAVSAANAASDPIPETTNLTITPRIDCRVGYTVESIILSTARGDAIDATFVFCRDPSKSRESWIRNLAKTRDQMMKGASDAAGKEAIRRAFDDHIARERAAG